MKYLKQLLIIIIFTIIGSLISAILPFNVPGSVIGLILLYIALEFKIIKLNQIKKTGNWLKNNMAFLFVPLSVGLMNDFKVLQMNFWTLSIVMIISTTITMMSVAWIAQKKEA